MTTHSKEWTISSDDRFPERIVGIHESPEKVLDVPHHSISGFGGSVGGLYSGQFDTAIYIQFILIFRADDFLAIDKCPGWFSMSAWKSAELNSGL
jgi:hypothetical protein